MVRLFNISNTKEELRMTRKRILPKLMKIVEEEVKSMVVKCS